jgi:hypothetical protein
MAKKAALPVTKLSEKQIQDLEVKLRQFVANVKAHRGIKIDQLLAGHGSHFQQ